MIINNQNSKKTFFLFTPIFILVFLIASTNTINVLSGLIIYILTLFVVFLLSLITDKQFESNFRKIALLLLLVSITAFGCGTFTFPVQKEINAEKAKKFVDEIERFHKTNKRLPKSSVEIKIPNSRNGLYLEEFEYYLPNVEQDEYIVKYFDGFWDTKVYVSSRKKWYNDD